MHSQDSENGPSKTLEFSTAGVGPWVGEWPVGDQYDTELLEHGDTRNVVDQYRYWKMDAIIADLEKHRHGFEVAIENWQHDLNIGSIVRSANAFAANTVHIVGRRRWNRRGAMVTDRYQQVLLHPTIDALLEYAKEQDLPIIAVDNTEGAVPVNKFDFPERCILLFGQEGPGLTPEAIAAASAQIEITQYGSTRSINASAAAAIIMYAWLQQHAK
ncbi:MAG: rRNA methyltransferase [Microbacteriaceae bacterium]|nr:rRNA methyltransferase [Microbacteriaceae bacterium]